MSLVDVAVGIGAALRSPRWTGGKRLQSLLREPTTGATRAGDPLAAIRASAITLRLLARFPFLPWRNTCLYRSVAECLVRRHYGLGGVLRLGVGHAKDCADAIAAHAWVEQSASDEPVHDFVPLRSSQ